MTDNPQSPLLGDNGKAPVTHTGSKPGKATTPMLAVKGLMASDEYVKQITNYFRGDKKEAMAFLTSSIEYIRRVPKLLECNHQSLLSSLMISAQFNFMPSGVSGEAYIIPYASEAKFQIGYQGWVTLIWRTKQLKSLKAVIVYENDEFRYEEGLTTILEHTPTKFGKKKGEPVGVYTVAETTAGGKLFKVMSKEEIMTIKELSKAKNSKESPWNSDKDPELWMWKKTCLIQLIKLLPKTKEIRTALEEDFAGEGLEKPALDAGGVAVGRAIHNTEEDDGNSF